MSSQPKIVLSVVIVSYNVKDIVLDAISSIYQFCSVSTQIIVADNNSNDGTIEAIKTQFPDVILIENKENYYLLSVYIFVKCLQRDFSRLGLGGSCSAAVS